MKTKTSLLLFLALFSLVALSCIIDTGSSFFDDEFSALPSVSSSSTLAPDSHWLYIDLNEDFYTNQGVQIPLYEINTTDEYGDTLSERSSSSNPEGISPSNCEVEFDPDIDFSEQHSKDTYCIMDVMEEEFNSVNLSLIYNIPDGMCHHVITRMPWHFNQDAGFGPSRIYKCEIQVLTGTDDEDNNECSTEERYFLSSSDCPSDDACPTPRAIRARGRADIQEFCARYDKSNQDKGNCCFGEYTVINPNDQNTSEVENGEWGGDLKTCIGGPARTSWEAFDDNGIPIPHEVLTTQEEGFRDYFTIEGISDAFNGTIAPYSLVWANYIKELDVESSRVPERVEQLLDGDNPLLSRDEIFAPYYFFSVACLDPASEALHALHLMVQEWNTYEEFYDHWVSKGATQDNDPDAGGIVVTEVEGVSVITRGGVEGSDCDYEEDRLGSTAYYPFCNDMFDLDDMSELGTPPEITLYQ